MTYKSLSQIEKIDAKLSKLLAQKQKLKNEIDAVLLKALTENDAFDVNFPTLLGAIIATVSSLKTNTFSQNDLIIFKTLGEKYAKKSVRKRPPTSSNTTQKTKAA
jgi:hypothetical protein